MRKALVILLATLVSLTGCHKSLTYSSDDVGAASWGAAAPRLIGPIEGRLVVPSVAYLVRGQPYPRDWADLSGSIRAHLNRAGLETLHTPAPTTPETARQAIAAAKAAGGQVALVRMHQWLCGEVFSNWVGFMFVIGLAPGLICMALPVHEEFALIQLQAVVVDARTQEVLGRYFVAESYNGTATGYTLGAVGDALELAKRATQGVITKISADARAGYPKRFKADDLAAELLKPVLPTPSPAAKAAAAAAQPQPLAATPTKPPAATAGAKVPWLQNYEQIKSGVTTRAEVLSLLGKPTLDQLDKATNRQMLFYVHAQPEHGKVVTRMFTVWLKTGGDVVDEVKYAQTK